MPEGQVLEFSGVTKRFGGVTAVSELTARVEPGVVTGFLGPNGAGKTTSLRMLLGLVRPTAGAATIGGVRYSKLQKPLQTVGAVLEASSFHPGRTGAAHLTVYAHAAGLPKARVDQVLGLVGLSDAGGRKVGGYSLGMRQRLGLAYALLGDPGVLVLDEPTNGLDPEGIRWIRGFLRELAREGRTVFVSSHLLAEVQQTVDSLLIISRGRLVFQGGLEELSDPTEQATVVDSDDRAALAQALTAEGIPYEVLRSGLTVRGIEPAAVGRAAAAAGVALTSLHKRGPALEEVFLDLVNGTRVHPSATGETIPALAAGTIETPEAEQDASTGEEPDASTGEEPEAVAGGGDATPDHDHDHEHDPDHDLPEAAADDVASVAAELDAESSGAPPAAAMSAAAGAAWAEEERRSDSGEHPAFSVASTGVIDIVTAQEEDAADAPAAADDEAESERATAEDHPAFVVAGTGVIDIITAEQSLGAAGAAASEARPDTASGPDPDDASEDDDRPWDPYVKTDSDHDADRFFAAFDEAAGRATGDPGAEDTESPSSEGAETSDEASADHVRRDEEGDAR